MTATIEYELDGETHSITRDEHHMDTPRYVTAYDNPDGEGVTRLVKIPDCRVVMIHDNDT